MRTKPLQSYDERARQRIIAWRKARPDVTQPMLAAVMGKSQTWMSKYEHGQLDASIDDLAKMAEFFGHSLSTVLETVALAPEEAELVERFRLLRVQARTTILALLRVWTDYPAAPFRE